MLLNKISEKAILLFILSLATYLHSSGQLDFRNPVHLQGLLEPSSMITGDFDGDNLVDIAFATVNSSQISIIYKEVDGSYSNISAIQGGEVVVQYAGYSNRITTGDFNKDGKSDIIVFNGYSTSTKKIYVLLSEGRTFKAPKIIETNAGLQGGAMDSGDINQDGHLDFIVGFQAFSTELYAYLGNSLGEFTLKKINITEDVDHLQLRDINNDNKLDIIRSNKFTSKLWISLGNGNGGISSEISITTSGIPMNFTIGDFSEDNKKDILVNIINAKSFDFFEGTGTGTFTKKTIPTEDNFIPYAGLSVCDYNMDGRDDFIASGSKNYEAVGIFTNIGNGQFEQKIFNNSAPSVTYQLSIIDSDQNGKFEIISAFQGRRLTIRTQDINQEFNEVKSIAYGQIPTGGATADFNKDGLIDFAIVSEYNNSIGLYLGQPNETLAQPELINLTQNPGSIELKDVDKDGIIDIIYSTRNGTDNEIGILYLDEERKVKNKKSLPVLNSPSLAVEDFNKDGFLDIFTNNTFYINDGAGDFIYTFVNMPFMVDFKAGDFDNDGNLDVFGTTSTSEGGFFYGDGLGGFQAQPFTFAQSALWVESSDINNDGLLDLITTNPHDNALSILKNKGNKVWEESKIQFINFNFPQTAICGDFNKDGNPDIGVGNINSSSVIVLTGNGDYTFTMFKEYPLNLYTSPYVILSTEVNNDNRIDLITLNASEKSITILFNDLVTEPTVAASDLLINNRTDQSATYSYTSGNGNGSMIVLSEVNQLNQSPNDNFFYPTNQNYGQGATFGSGFVIKRNNETSGEIKNLKPNTSYFITVFEYSSNQKNTLINYLPNPAFTGTFKTKNIQTISFTPVSAKILGDADFTITASATSDLPLTITQKSGNISVTGKNVKLLNQGPAVIQLSQPGSDDYMPAPNVEITFCVNPVVPTISYAASAAGKYILTSSSALNNIWLKNNVAINGQTNQTIEVSPDGVYKVKVDYSGCSNTSASVENQNINFTTIAAKEEGQPDFTLSATASSSLPVLYEVVSGGVTVNTSTAKINAPGPAKIKAIQEGNNSFFPAPPLEQTFCVNPKVPTITYSESTNGKYILTSSSTVNNIWLKNDVVIDGQTSKTIEVTPDATYKLKVDYSGCFSISQPVSPQVISFPDLTFTADESSLTILPNSNSLLEIKYEVISGGIEINNSVISIIHPGPAKIRASQGGNNTFFPFSSVEIAFCVNPKKPTITITNTGFGPYTLTSSSDINNIWFINDSPISGATSKSYIPIQDGIYSVKVDYSGCFNTSLPTNNLITDIEEITRGLSIYPNPSTNYLTLQWPKEHPTIRKITITDIQGKNMELAYVNKNESLEMNISRIAPGIYTLSIQTHLWIFSQKIIKQ